MTVIGIITEYNPFHAGHAYQIEQARKITGADTVVAIMSGDFVQRGEPAFADKWTRAEAAIKGGADLVLELPFVYATGNAERFAQGGVAMLCGLGCIDHISFGSESGDADAIIRAAAVLAEDSDDFNALVKEGMAKGYSYPKARHEALKSLIGEAGASVLETPNDTLGTEYIKQLILNNSNIKPVIVKRANFPKAKEIREARANEAQATMENLRELLIYKVITTPPAELSKILSATEGLENRLIKAVRTGGTMEEIIKHTKTKRYTQTRIQRLIIHTILGINKGEYEGTEGIYGRILAFNEKGRALLRKIKKQELSTYPLITNPVRQRDQLNEAQQKTLKINKISEDIYSLIANSI
jgi:predicted nucleotidyltransferase